MRLESKAKLQQILRDNNLADLADEYNQEIPDIGLTDIIIVDTYLNDQDKALKEEFNAWAKQCINYHNNKRMVKAIDLGADLLADGKLRH